MTPLAALGLLILFTLALCVVAWCMCSIGGAADDADEQVMRALTEGNGFHPPFRALCSSACCRGLNRDEPVHGALSAGTEASRQRETKRRFPPRVR